MKIPTEDFTDETLVIDDTHEDDVRGGDWGAGHGGVADEVTDIEVDKMTNMVVEIPYEDFLIWLAIIDTYRYLWR